MSRGKQTVKTVLLASEPAIQCLVCIYKLKRTLVKIVLARSRQQLFDEVEQNVVNCQWRADQLFTEVEC